MDLFQAALAPRMDLISLSRACLGTGAGANEKP
eukprot:COSAG06_NODE_45614_length_353_cov_0.964567_1_plen_32_part_10